MKKILLPILQLGVTAYILVRLFGDETLRANAARVLAEADWRWIAGAAVAAAASELLCATRWWIVLRAFGMPLRWREAVAFSAVGLFYSLGLPGSAGGDAMRTLYVIGRYPDKKLAAAFSVLADRFCGLAALVPALAWTLAANHGLFLEGRFAKGIVIAAVVFLSGALLALVLWWATTIPAMGDRVEARMSRLGIHLRQSGEIFNRMLAQPGAMLAGVALSCASLAAHFLGYWLSACAFGAGLGAATIFSIMPVVDTLTMIPIALYGLGLREALFTALLGEFYGVPAGTAMLVSLGGFTAQAAVALSGILFLPFVKFVRLGRREG
jgi:uncharacterized protein (TIRG00374 family)